MPLKCFQIDSYICANIVKGSTSKGCLRQALEPELSSVWVGLGAFGGNWSWQPHYQSLSQV